MYFVVFGNDFLSYYNMSDLTNNQSYLQERWKEMNIVLHGILVGLTTALTIDNYKRKDWLGGILWNITAFLWLALLIIDIVEV